MTYIPGGGAGGVKPIERSLANTELVEGKTAQTITLTDIDATTNTKIRRRAFGGFDISDYYEGDIIFGRLELNDDGATTNADIGVLSIEVSGIKWTHGEKL